MLIEFLVALDPATPFEFLPQRNSAPTAKEASVENDVDNSEAMDVDVDVVPTGE
jgi:hypothetical protein